MENDWESPKEEVRGPTGSQKGAWRRPPACPLAYLTPLPGDPQAARRVPGAAPPPGRARHPPGCLVAPHGAPFRLFHPPGVETPKQELLPRFAAATVRKYTEEKSHLRRVDSAGEITSRKGR